MTDDFKPQFSPRELYALRKSADMTQTDMANELDMTLRGYQKLESGDSPIKSIHMKAAQFVLIERMANGKVPEDEQIHKLVEDAASHLGKHLLEDLI